MVARPGSLRRMLLPPSELSIVAAALSGDIDIEGDAERAMDVLGHRAERTVGEMGALHAPERDRAAIRYHYDVSNEFFALWLDPGMVSSCAYYASDASPNAGLDDAQRAKLDVICRKLQLRRGERLLDVGCGWGALIMHAVRDYGMTALGITLSERQASMARERTAQAALPSHRASRLATWRASASTTR